jgi:hypothetical protein
VLAEDERGAQRRHRNAPLTSEGEERALAVRLLRTVRVGIAGWHELDVLDVLASRVVDRHAGGEDVAAQSVRRRRRGGAHLLARGTALPVVDVVVDDVEAASVERRVHRRDVVAIADDLVDARAVRRSTSTVHDDHIVATLEELVDERAADEEGPADDECARHDSPVAESGRKLPHAMSVCPGDGARLVPIRTEP